MKKTIALIFILLALAPVFARASFWQTVSCFLDVYGTVQVKKDGSLDMLEWSTEFGASKRLYVGQQLVDTTLRLGWCDFYDGYNRIYCWGQAAFAPLDSNVNYIWINADIGSRIEDGGLLPPVVSLESIVQFAGSGYAFNAVNGFTFSFNDMEKESGLMLGVNSSFYYPIVNGINLNLNGSTTMRLVDGGVKFDDTYVNASMYHTHESGVSTNLQAEFQYSYDLGPDRNGIYIYSNAVGSDKSIETQFSFHFAEEFFQLNYACMSIQKRMNSDYIEMRLGYSDYVDGYEQDNRLQWTVQASVDTSQYVTLNAYSSFNIFFCEDGLKYKEYLSAYINDSRVFSKNSIEMAAYANIYFIPFNTYDDVALMLVLEPRLNKIVHD